MTNQEKIRFLRQYQDTGREIQRIQDELCSWESLSQKITVSLGGTGGGNGEDKLQVSVEKIEAWRQKLVEQITERACLREKIEQVIVSVPEVRLRLLLRYRYIDGRTWEWIAVEMHLDYRWVRRLHGRIINNLTLESPLQSVI